MPKGAAAYTDGARIFAPIGVSSADERTIIRHESAHVWLRHFRRRQNRKPDVWAVACEMEIARNIYDEKDLRTISSRYSVLYGAYKPDSIKDCPPNLRLAEDIYDWLMQQSSPIQIQCNCKQCGSDGKDGDSNGEAKDGDKPGQQVSSSTLDKARDTLDSQERQAVLQKSVVKAVRQKQPPSFASEMDALFRAALSRERSYRRPSRRECRDFIERGRVNHIRTPRVQIYVDRSGSFTADKTKQAIDKLESILSRYSARIKSDTFYFGNQRLEQFDFGGGGNTPYDLVVAHINSTSPEAAVVITDDDSADGCGKVVVPSRLFVCPIGCTTTSLGSVIGAMGA